MANTLPTASAVHDRTGFPVPRSHRRIVPSPPAVAATLPSGDTAAFRTPLVCSSCGCNSRRVTTSHTRTRPLVSATASVFPPGANDRL
jgi:hypothetical protein